MTECLYEDDAYRTQCDAVIVDITEHGLQLDRTVFYPTGGGQPGDSGVLHLEDRRTITITTTTNNNDGSILHATDDGLSGIVKGTKVRADLNWQRRYQHMKVHTCLHLLCALIHAPVTGCSIGAERGRLDFDLPEHGLDKERLSQELNDLISGNHTVAASWIEEEQLEPHLVRTLSVGPPLGLGRIRLIGIKDVDLQPCGGTHVANTAEIGRVRVAKVEKKSRHNRRVVIEFSPTTID